MSFGMLQLTLRDTMRPREHRFCLVLLTPETPFVPAQEGNKHPGKIFRSSAPPRKLDKQQQANPYPLSPFRRTRSPRVVKKT